MWDRLGAEDGIGWRVGRGDNRLRREVRVGGDRRRGSERAWSLALGAVRCAGTRGCVWCGALGLVRYAPAREGALGRTR